MGNALDAKQAITRRQRQVRQRLPPKRTNQLTVRAIPAALALKRGIGRGLTLQRGHNGPASRRDNTRRQIKPVIIGRSIELQYGAIPAIPVQGGVNLSAAFLK